jgi:hydroxypyruvate reductase
MDNHQSDSGTTPKRTAPAVLDYFDHLEHLTRIRQAAMLVAEPAAAVARNLSLEGDQLVAGAHRIALISSSRIFLIALGKAAPAMCLAVAKILDERLTSGIAAIPDSHGGPMPEQIRGFPAGHPLPDEGSLAAGQAVGRLLSTTSKDDVVLVLISGGGSAMLELPLPGISLDDLRTVNTLLIRSGAPIKEINIVRQSLSQIKGGGLARLAAPASSVALILSDVVGDRLSTIASGPTVTRRATPKEALVILERYSLTTDIPTSILAVLRAVASSKSRVPRPINILIGGNRLVVDAASKEASNLGFPSRVLNFQMRGEARHVGKRFAEALRRSSSPMCLLMGGETTVTVQGSGRGGRNQEMALAAAMTLEGIPKVAVMTLATDGVDGPTDAAGAIVTGETIPHAHSLGLSPESALAENDVYPLLYAVNALIRTGPSGTNLNDLAVGLVYP